MNSDCHKRDSAMSERDSENDGISRRDLLVAASRSAVGLSLIPLSSALAGEQKGTVANLKAATSEFLTGRTPVGINVASSACSLLGDISGDGKVDEEDMQIMATEWLTNNSSAISNLDGSFTQLDSSAASAVYVDFEDYSVMANDWGKSCSASSAISLLTLRTPVRRRFSNRARQRFSESINRLIETV